MVATTQKALNFQQQNWHIPHKKISGEGGIRTHGALRLTRSPGARTRPDYATSPYYRLTSVTRRRKLYHGGF